MGNDADTVVADVIGSTAEGTLAKLLTAVKARAASHSPEIRLAFVMDMAYTFERVGPAVRRALKDKLLSLPFFPHAPCNHSSAAVAPDRFRPWAANEKFCQRNSLPEAAHALLPDNVVCLLCFPEGAHRTAVRNLSLSLDLAEGREEELWASSVGALARAPPAMEVSGPWACLSVGVFCARP